jgi:hypothetical protein
MRTPDTTGGHITEMIMAALRKADVLKPDEPNHPVHYNRAWSTVLRTLEPFSEQVPAAAKLPAPPIVPHVPNDLGNYRKR